MHSYAICTVATSPENMHSTCEPSRFYRQYSDHRYNMFNLYYVQLTNMHFLQTTYTYTVQHINNKINSPHTMYVPD